jgi:hypothetical protein
VARDGDVDGAVRHRAERPKDRSDDHAHATPMVAEPRRAADAC